MSDIVTPLRHWIANLAERFAGRALESIHHKLDKWLLGEAHRQLNARKAPGFDGVTKPEYSNGLSERLDDLVNRVKSLGKEPSRQAGEQSENGAQAA